MGGRVVFWDFDGTLGFRTDGYWTGCMMKVLDTEVPGHSITIEDVRPLLRSGFPWHRHTVEHPELVERDAWWSCVGELIIGAYVNLGFPKDQAERFASSLREIYVEPRSWELYGDVESALRLLKDEGWRHAVISNHVPELGEICDSLGLGTIVEEIMTSASHPWEKPHPEIFKLALAKMGKPETAWMVGDNPVADVMGAERVGIPSILVRPQEMTTEYVRKLTESYGGDGWDDWPSYITRTAAGALDAANLIIAS